jgi:hypothetical protein
MPRALTSIYSLNRGVVDRRGLARQDVKRLAMAAQVQTNWIPKVLGPMTMRPGLEYFGATLANEAARLLRFVFATDDTAFVELTDGAMRVWIDDVLLSRPAVTTVIVNGTWPANLGSWTDMDDAGAASTWIAADATHTARMQLLGNGTARAMREQHVVCLTPDVEHGIRVVISRGPVMLRIGSTSGDDDLLSETVLYTGTHSLSIVPAGDFYIRFSATQATVAWVGSCTIEAAGVVSITSPWSGTQLDSLRYDQSADVLFCACKGVQQRRIERRGARPGARGWSMALYQAPDGPFMLQNTTPTTLTPSAITGNITVASSVPLFKSTHVGSLFSVTSVGQQTQVASSSANSFSSAIRVTGLAAQRGFGIIITGIFVGTVVLQQSFDNAVWSDVPGETWTGPVSTSYNDGLDNQIVFYRIGIEAAYTSGTATSTLSFTAGSIRGIVRITDFTNSQLVGAEVLTSLGGTSASAIWEEGKWSDLRGWPTAVGIHEGRMWWAGQNGVQGSISDAFDSFDETFLGDAGPIDRTVGAGPVDTINWVMSLKGLLLGAQGAEYSVRSSSLDEPLTPTNFNLKASSTQGSGNTPAVKVDQSGYFVDRTGCKVFEMAFDIRSYDYSAVDMMSLAPEIGQPGIVRVDVQRKPDTRVHAVRSDGKVVVCVLNRQEEVTALVLVETDGYIEDVCVLPARAGELDDQVKYVVRRIIGGATVRYLERWAQETDCRGGQLNRLADAHVSYSGIPTRTIAAAHLEGQEVVVWGDGVDVGTDDSVTPWAQRYTVSGGVVTLPAAVSNAVVGLAYEAPFQSAKLGAQGGPSTLNQQKKLGHIGLVLADTHRRGLRFGPDFNTLDDMPLIEDGDFVTQEVAADYDENPIEFPGSWTTDMRVCLLGAAPRPATVMAVTIDEVQNS